MTRMLNNAQRKAHLYQRLQRNFPEWEFDIKIETTSDVYFSKVIVVRAEKPDCRVVVASDKAVDVSWLFTQAFYWRVAKCLKA